MLTKNKKIIFGSVVIICILLVAYVLQSTYEFKKSFETYARLAKIHSDDAFIPGIPENPIRQRLNSVLSQVLARPMTPTERIALAEEGLAALKDAELQIDAIGDAGEKVQNAISYMDAKSRAPGAFLSRQTGAEAVILAKEEFNIVADIRGLSYRANFHTAEIFNRIVLDKGELTKSYSDELNNQIPAVEEQFNKRTALYNQLKSVIARLEKLSVTL